MKPVVLAVLTIIGLTFAIGLTLAIKLATGVGGGDSTREQVYTVGQVQIGLHRPSPPWTSGQTLLVHGALIALCTSSPGFGAGGVSFTGQPSRCPRHLVGLMSAAPDPEPRHYGGLLAGVTPLNPFFAPLRRVPTVAHLFQLSLGQTAVYRVQIPPARCHTFAPDPCPDVVIPGVHVQP